MKEPKVIKRVTEYLERLPGIGPKTAQRLTYYLLHMPQEQVESFGEALIALKRETMLCSVCRNIDEMDPCFICTKRDREVGVICVVEQPLDINAIEKSGKFKGLYHVLHGVISPLEHIGPDELYIGDLLKRVSVDTEEVILALNPSMEGEATSLYLKQEIDRLGLGVRMTQLAQGLPLGGDLEYADAVTLSRALEGRREY